MMLAPVQVAACIGCQVCAQECPTNAITIESGVAQVVLCATWTSLLPARRGWLAATRRLHPRYTRRAGRHALGRGHAWHVAERQATWQSWRTWLGERKEDLRAPCQAACPVGTNAGLYVSLIAEGRYDEALRGGLRAESIPSDLWPRLHRAL